MGQELCVVVCDEDRARLGTIIDDRNRPLKHIQRARIVLLSAARLPVLQVANRVGVGRSAVWRWQRRYAEAGVAGLLHDKTRPPGKKPVPAATVAKVLALTCGEPPGEMTHWTGRAMAKTVGLSLRTVQRIWQANRLQPHRVRTFKRSTDPAFAEKVEDIVGLYMHPPAHAVVLSIDEKSQIQALDRTQPGLPMKPGKCGTMTHDYKRHGTTTLFAAFNTLRLQGWGRSRRVVMPRRRVPETLAVTVSRADGQSDLFWTGTKPGAEIWEFAVLVTSLDLEICSLAQLYRDRGDSENPFDELKNQWGWAGFTTSDLTRCQIMARLIALVYNWWTLYVRLADPDHHHEALTTRSLLLNAVARQTRHAGQTRLTVTSSHGRREHVTAALQRIARFFTMLRKTAEQLTDVERWACILSYALRKYLRGRKLQPPPNLLPA